MKFNSLLLQFLLGFGLIFSLQSCYTFDSSQIQNLNEGKVVIIGHGGLGFHRWMPFQALPSNSKSSILKALETGAEGVEVDIQMTQDGQFLLYHDNDLASMTNLQSCIASQNYSAVKDARYKLGIPFDWFQDESILTLDELFQIASKQDIKPILQFDMRTYSMCFEYPENRAHEENFIRNLDVYLSQIDYPKRKLFLIGVTREGIELAKSLNMPYQLSLEVISDFDDALSWAVEKGINILTVKSKLLSKENTAKAHAKGVKIITFGAKSKGGNLKLLKLNPDYLQTDNIEAVKELLYD
tara:strand:- start:997 stop:1890 length:894 start_codon:yes stop_codon:yes gene_type:complete